MSEGVLDLRVCNCEEKGEELQAEVSNLDELISTVSDRTYALELWRNGNGAKGAEARLQGAEESIRALEDIDAGPRLNVLEADLKVIQRVSDASIQSNVAAVLTQRDRSAIAKLKAWGPIVAAGLVFIATVLQIILGKIL